MGLLRILRLGFIAARRRGDVARTIIGIDHTAHRGDRFLGDLHAVGTHISNETDGLAADIDALIEPLCDPHGVRRREAQLSARLLLQGRRGERRLRMPFDRLGLDRGHRERCGLEGLLERFGLGARTDIETLQLLAVGPDETRFEGFVAGCRKRGDQRPIFAADEFFDLKLAVANEAQRDRLHPSGRARAGQFAPQDRGEREPHQIIKRAAGEIRVDQGLVDGARMLHRLGNCLLGDGVENHTLDRLFAERFLLLEEFEHVPRDRLALAIRVGGEDQLVGVLDCRGDVVEPLLRLGIDLPKHAKIRLRVDRSALRRQVADMAERGQHFVAAAQILIDRFCLGGQFHQYQIHDNPMIYRPFCASAAYGAAACPPGTWVMRPRLSNRRLRRRPRAQGCDAHLTGQTEPTGNTRSKVVVLYLYPLLDMYSGAPRRRFRQPGGFDVSEA